MMYELRMSFVSNEKRGEAQHLLSTHYPGECLYTFGDNEPDDAESIHAELAKTEASLDEKLGVDEMVKKALKLDLVKCRALRLKLQELERESHGKKHDTG